MILLYITESIFSSEHIDGQIIKNNLLFKNRWHVITRTTVTRDLFAIKIGKNENSRFSLKRRLKQPVSQEKVIQVVLNVLFSEKRLFSNRFHVFFIYFVLYSICLTIHLYSLKIVLDAPQICAQCYDRPA